MNFSEMTTMQKLMLLHGVVGGKAVEDFASGNPCVFTTDLAKPLRRLALTLLPKQDGTGDPSLQNIRSLLPWGEVGTWTGGKNFAKLTYGTKVPSINTGEMVTSNGWSSDFIRIDNTKNYYCSGNASLGNVYTLYYGADHSYLGNRSHNSADSALSFSLNSDLYFSSATYIKLRNDSPSNKVLNIQLEEGQTATAYEEPHITPHPVDLTGITPPVYGCELDLTTGEVWGTYVLWEKNTADMNNDASYPGWKNAGIRDIVGTGKGGAIQSVVNVGNVFAINTRNANDIVYFPFTEYGLTQDEWIALAIDVEIALPLETPVLLSTLTPQQINALVGVNTVWSDADNVDVTYLKKG